MFSRSRDQLPACPRAGAQPVDPRHRETNAGQRLDAFVGGKHQHVGFWLCRHVERQCAERRDGIDDHPPSRPTDRFADRRHVLDHAATSLGVDHAHVRQGGIGGQRFLHRLRIGRPVGIHHHRHRYTSRFTGETDHPVGIGTGRGNEQLAPGREEGADGRFGQEMAAALQRQHGMLLGDAVRGGQYALAQPGQERAKVVVPGRQVLRHRGADFGAGRHGAGNQQQHGFSWMFAAKPSHAGARKSTAATSTSHRLSSSPECMERSLATMVR